MNLSKDLLPHGEVNVDEKVKPFIAVFERAVEEKRIRQDVDVWKLLAGCGVVLMGCLQIWATGRKERDLSAIVKEGIEIVLKP